MPADQRKVAPAIIKEATTLLREHFGIALKISSAVFLSEPDRRNALVRLSLESQDSSVPRHVILKQHLPERTKDADQEAFLRFARDWAAHMFLAQLCNSELLIPKFYAGSIKDRFIMLQDLGPDHVSLVDALTGTNKEEAVASLQRYTIQMATLHGLAYRDLEGYNLIFNKLKAIIPTNNYYDDAIREIVPVLNRLGIILSSDIKNEIKHVLKILKQPGAFTTLIHGDLCPDNVFDYPNNNQLRIIDFEWSSLSNALLDGVYIRMNMPTCWCAKAFPEDVIEQLELLYRKELAKNIPSANDDKLYFESYAAACAYWMLWNITILKEIWDHDNDLLDPKFHNLHKNWRAEYQLRRPRVLSRLAAFIEISHTYNSLPHLRVLAALVQNELHRIWPEVEPMGLYRAFL